MKQSKLRRRRVIRYAVLYFVMFVVMLGIVVAPGVLQERGMMKQIGIVDTIKKTLGGDLGALVQPDNRSLMDDTWTSSQTGTGNPTYPKTTTPGGAQSTADSNNRIKLI